MIIIDSREKNFKHIADYFDKVGVHYTIEKLETGDYFNPEQPSVLVDRKSGLEEVNGNLSKGKSKHARFVRECQRAFKAHDRLVILIEEHAYKSVEDIKDWQSKYSIHNGRWLANEMFRLTMAYGIEWKFCSKRESGKKILEILGHDKCGDKTKPADDGPAIQVRNQSQEQYVQMSFPRQGPTSEHEGV